MHPILDQLQQHPEPSIRYKVRTGVAGADPPSPEIPSLREEVRASERVRVLLSERLPDGRIPHHPYQKWRGAHWVLATLAELGYPPGDAALLPLREQVLGWLLDPAHLKYARWINGRFRRCSSQEGNALWALLSLGLAEDRAAELASRLVAWQWPDGGWNCDKKPAASHASFWESLLPLRALALYHRQTGDAAAGAAAHRAAEFFLRHCLYRRESSGEPMNPEFLQLHFPCYWHYDILFGLKVMAEADCLDDPRCQDVLDRLETKRLPGGGFAVGGKYYRVSTAKVSNTSLVDWGPSRANVQNDWVTVDALSVLAAAHFNTE